MNNKRKILILGIGKSTFLNPLYNSILEKREDISFFIDGYQNYSTDEASNPYADFYDFKSLAPSKWDLKFTLLHFLKKKFFWQILFFEMSQKTSFKKFKEKIKRLVLSKYRVENHIAPLNFNAYHFHFCIPQNIEDAYFLSNSSPIILSFWGSDLMRFTGIENVFYLDKALHKAKVITIQTPELAEMFYCKYGRKYKKKVVILRFPLNKKIFNFIDNSSLSDLINFKKTYNIPSEKTSIALGHNGFLENNHRLMIEQIKKLPLETTEELVFILHLSYGGDKEYLSTLLDLTKENTNLNFVIINKYLGSKEIALLRLSTDILIHLPETDALSAAMTEILYAGRSVITGSWLPYGLLRRNGINYHEIENFSDLPQLIKQAAGMNKKYKHLNTKNKEAIKSLLLSDNIPTAWIKVINSVI